jgi:hypothetical protein
MQEIKRYLLIVGLLSFGFVYAQDVRTAKLRWNSSESVELKSNTSSRTVFEIHTSASELKVITGNQTRIFKVQSIEGQWSDVKTNGSLNYQLVYGEKEGLATIQRDNSGWYFLLDFSNHKDGIRQKFILSDFQVTQ